LSYCNDILKKAKTLHLDECEVVSIQKKITTVRITDSEIAETKQNQDESIAVRVINEKKIMSARSSSRNAERFLEKVLETKSFVQPKNF
jgi:PmbA protein